MPTLAVAGPPTAQKEPEEGDPRQWFIEAKPIGALPSPPYPRHALAAKAGWAIIGARIDIDDQGRVTDVEPGVLAPSTPTPFKAEFMASIRSTVLGWRFQPAQIETDVVERSPECLYWALQDRRPSESFTELAFTFTGTGRTLLGARAAAGHQAK